MHTFPFPSHFANVPYNKQLITTAATPTKPAVSKELDMLAAEDGLVVVAAGLPSVRLATPLVAPVAVTFLVTLPFAETSARLAMVMLALATHLSLARTLAEALNVISAHCFVESADRFPLLFPSQKSQTRG